MARRRESVVVVETTLPVRDAARIAGIIVKARLAACGTWTLVRSTYWWKGRRETAREALLSFKTTPRHADQLVARLEHVHPYDVPYIAWMPLRIGSDAYAAWVQAETRVETASSTASRTSPRPRKR